jgi:1-acyl-sn-glycerol-3-phosphate acyltransferase
VARRRNGLAFSVAVAIVKPTMLAISRREWHGGGNIPRDGGCILVPNHISEIDPFVIAHFTYDNGRLPRFLGKAEVFAVPVVGRFLRACGQIPVYRRSSAAADAFTAAVAAVNAGEAVIVYAEGTLTRDPGLWPMVGKTGAARIALATGCPVIPVAQWGSQHILPPYAWRPRLFPRKLVRVMAGPPVDLSMYEKKPITPAVLRAATDAIMADLVRVVAQLREEQPPAERYDPREHGEPEFGNPRRRRPGDGAAA